MWSRIKGVLPQTLQTLLDRLPAQAQAELEEIRIREGRPLEIGCGGRSLFVGSDGRLWESPSDGVYKPDALLCRQLLEKITKHSLYAMEEELRRGYITVEGGHRIGLAGRTVLEGGAVRGIRDVSGFNVRIAREVRGAADGILPQLLDRQRQSIASTLILGPPQQGKTTLLRDLARSVSTGNWHHPDAVSWSGRKVGIVDERSEIAACYRGVPAFDVGPRTDVMDACPKAEGMMMLVRSMSPEVIVIDEIGSRADAEAIREASRAGIRLVATAHAYDLEDAQERPLLRELIEEGVFDSAVTMRRTGRAVRCSVQSLAPASRRGFGRQLPSARGHPLGAAEGGGYG
ncbi:stage III sporulation protein AA [Paenibacillus sp. 598K]|uniref:stage III sporulation protein AA n=1 Tax=Paenibacillus sp. 598K TaxID=1117987 RepID=UPI000FF9170E|nr:stage III sporulation protein AA [Paenibacillus sp. 598K]GBF72648.1 stage III sporulation protein AA [Paenibacillus sp. 598K]